MNVDDYQFEIEQMAAIARRINWDGKDIMVVAREWIKIQTQCYKVLAENIEETKRIVKHIIHHPH